MATNDPSTPPLRVRQILPNGPAVLAQVHENIVTNLIKDQPPSFTLPTLWRLAAHVVKEKTPILIYEFEQEVP